MKLHDKSVTPKLNRKLVNSFDYIQGVQITKTASLNVDT